MSDASSRDGRGPVLASRLAAALERACSVLCGLVLAALFATVLVAVGARYLFGASIFGADEAALWLFAGLVFLGLPLASSSVLSLRLDLVSALLGARGKAALDILADAIVVYAMLVLLFGGRAVLETIGGVSPTLALFESWRFWPVLAGAGATLALGLLKGFGEGQGARAVLSLVLGTALYLVSTRLAFEPLSHPSLVAAAIAFCVLLLGAPLPHAMISGVALSLPFGGLLPEPAIVQTTVSSLGRFLLLAIPFFLLAGALMTAGGLAHRLVTLARAAVGHQRGGMAQTVLGTNMMISGISGSSIADAAFGAKVLAPALVRHGETPERAAAIVAATAILPNVAPPSIALLLLATATDLSVGRLFVGGLVAALVLAAAMAVGLRWSAAPGARLPRASRSERLAALGGGLPVLGLVLVILFGLRFGVVTTTEAAALAALYALVATLVATRDLRAVGQVFARTGAETAAVGLLVATAAPFVFLLAVDGLPGLVRDLFSGFDSALAVLLIANLVLLAAGSVLDVGAGILLLGPLLMPVATAAGIDPIQFAVILVVNLVIGGLTPPVGILVFVAARLSGVSPSKVFVAVMPLLAVQIAALLLLSLSAAFLAR